MTLALRARTLNILVLAACVVLAAVLVDYLLVESLVGGR